MSELCFKYCPAYMECQSVQAGAEAALSSYASEQSSLQAAVTAANAAEINGAMAVLTGEVTAEQSEALQRNIEAAGIIRPDYAKMLSELSVAIEEQTVKTQNINSTIGSLFFAIEDCSGPVLPFWQKQRAAMSDAKQKRAYRGHVPDELIVSQRDSRLFNSGKCSSTEVRQAVKAITSVK